MTQPTETGRLRAELEKLIGVLADSETPEVFQKSADMNDGYQAGIFGAILRIRTRVNELGGYRAAPVRRSEQTPPPPSDVRAGLEMALALVEPWESGTVTSSFKSATELLRNALKYAPEED